MRFQLEAIISVMRSERLPYEEALREFRKTFISVVLRELRGNQTKAAQRLHIHRNTLSRAIKDLDIETIYLRRRRQLHPRSL
jgi:Fis family transcriptional regulator, factor for inversion stimulation protein